MEKTKYSIDTSALLYARDEYPMKLFPRVWEWLANAIEEYSICLLKTAYREIESKDPECYEWIRLYSPNIINENNEMVQMANRIKNDLGIQNDAYGKGVGENDLLIIAHAKVEHLTLISQEKRQSKSKPPAIKKNYKIPLVCSENGTTCINFLELLKESGKIF